MTVKKSQSPSKGHQLFY